MPLNKYAPQAATHRRTQSAILEGAKHLIATVGLAKMSMIEIADTSQVSRATLYNHYRDKDSVIRSLCESEMQRLVAIAQVAPDATSALEQISIEVSADKALASMRRQDPEYLALALSAQNDTLWKAFSIAMGHLLGQEKGELATRWLIGQALHPITSTQSRAQAEAITSIAHL